MKKWISLLLALSLTLGAAAIPAAAEETGTAADTVTSATATANGRRQQGAPNGQAPDRQMPDGQMPDGQMPDGQAPNGQEPNGQMQMPGNHSRNGQMRNGQMPGGFGQNGQMPGGFGQNGQHGRNRRKPGADQAQPEMPEGTTPESPVPPEQPETAEGEVNTPPEENTDSAAAQPSGKTRQHGKARMDRKGKDSGISAGSDEIFKLLLEKGIITQEIYDAIMNFIASYTAENAPAAPEVPAPAGEAANG